MILTREQIEENAQKSATEYIDGLFIARLLAHGEVGTDALIEIAAESFTAGADFAISAAEEREKLWREYADLLATDLYSAVALAAAHGWPGNERSYKEGIRLRAALGIAGEEGGEG